MKDYTATVAMQWLVFVSRKEKGVTVEEAKKAFGPASLKALLFNFDKGALEVNGDRLCITEIGKEILRTIEEKAGKQVCALYLGSIGVDRN